MPKAMNAEAEHMQTSIPDYVQAKKQNRKKKKDNKEEINGQIKKMNAAGGGGGRYPGRPNTTE